MREQSKLSLYAPFAVLQKMKHERTFYNAWKLSADFLQCVESARGDVLQSVEKLRAVSTVRGVLT